jgi:hypothetical protein
MRGKKKNLFDNQLRAALRKSRSFLKQNGLYNGDSVNDIALAFAKYLNIEVSCHPQVWLVELWRSGENDLLQKTERGFYLSPQWTTLRRQALREYGAICMKCGSIEGIQVDHIKPRSLFPELELELDNLQILCRPCNSAKSNRIIADYR